jgi:hypothetical protein
MSIFPSFTFLYPTDVVQTKPSSSSKSWFDWGIFYSRRIALVGSEESRIAFLLKRREWLLKSISEV